VAVHKHCIRLEAAAPSVPLDDECLVTLEGPPLHCQQFHFVIELAALPDVEKKLRCQNLMEHMVGRVGLGSPTVAPATGTGLASLS
jgi:hypothetical protein